MSEFEQVPVPTERPKVTFVQQLQKKDDWTQAKIRNYLVLGLILYTAVSYFVFIGVGGTQFSSVSWLVILPLLAIGGTILGGSFIALAYFGLIYVAGLVGIAFLYVATKKLSYRIGVIRAVGIVGLAFVVLHLPLFVLSQRQINKEIEVTQQYIDTYVEVFSQADPQLFGGTFPIQKKLAYLNEYTVKNYSKELDVVVRTKVEMFDKDSAVVPYDTFFTADGNYFCIYSESLKPGSYRDAKKSTEKCKEAGLIGGKIIDGQDIFGDFIGYVVVGEGTFQQQGPYKYGVNPNADFP